MIQQLVAGFFIVKVPEQSLTVNNSTTAFDKGVHVILHGSVSSAEPVLRASRLWERLVPGHFSRITVVGIRNQVVSRSSTAITHNNESQSLSKITNPIQPFKHM